MSWLKSFLKGAGSVLNVGGTKVPPYRPKRVLSDAEALKRDQEALASYWRAVGGDLQSALDHFRTAHPGLGGEQAPARHDGHQGHPQRRPDGDQGPT